MENWKNLRFFDVGSGEFEITHKTGNKFTVKIIKKPEEGKLTIANPKWKLSNCEFVISEKRFEENLKFGNITIQNQN
jgi:glucokinase